MGRRCFFVCVRAAKNLFLKTALSKIFTQLLDFQNAVAGRIDDGRRSIFRFPHLIYQPIPVRMPMNEVTRLVGLDERAETLESLMAEVGFVVDAQGRGMRDDNIEIPLLEEFVFP